jgi:hypothetical protein
LQLQFPDRFGRTKAECFKAETNDAGNNSFDRACGCGAGGALLLAARAAPMTVSMS